MGAADGEVLLLVGTRKGLFRVTSSGGRAAWTLDGPLLAGWEVYHAVADPRDPARAWAAVRHEVWGAHLHRSDDGGRSWEQLAGRPTFPDGRALEAVWHVAPGGGDEPGRLYAGVEPAALFASDDAGASWRLVAGLEDHPTRDRWQPAKGGMALHSIQVDPRNARRVYVAVSAGGCYRTDDGGTTWHAVNHGTRAEFLPDDRPEAGQCVHSLRLHPARPDRLYQQSHCGTYRSDDRGESWTEITGELPSDFGYVVGLDPSDPDRCWVVPEESSHMRSTCGGRMRLYETRDGGDGWTPRTSGLPQEHAYVSVLREALATDGLDPCGVYLGTSSGHLFVGPDGRSWREVAAHLPRVLSVTASQLP